jgi:DnaJ homolog subfamily C member 3
LKQSRQKDYYKVLGVSRDADDRTIKKALCVLLSLKFCIRQLTIYIRLYSRRAAMTAHPDKGGSEAKMAVVNEAYEVLSKPGTCMH